MYEGKLVMDHTVIGVFVNDTIEKSIFENAFQRLEHKVDGHVFTNPESGLTQARNLEFDVVFIEIHFWGENFGGISILQQLKMVSRKRIIAIAITSFLQEGDIEKIINSGFAMCIEKPVSIEALQIFCGHAAAN
jgi:CheY-like chemotaxis protein